MLLSTRNIKLKGTAGKLQKRFVGSFQVFEIVGHQAYKLSLLEDWKIYPVFHVSLLKEWRTASLQKDQLVPTDVPEVEEPYYEIERILWWRTVKYGHKILKKYLVLLKGYPIEDATWVQAQQFSHPR